MVILKLIEFKFRKQDKGSKITFGHRGIPPVKISCGKPIVTEEVSMPVSESLTHREHHQVEERKEVPLWSSKK